MAITRTAWTDDSGTGTDGTVLNNAVKTELYDQIDAALVGGATPALDNLAGVALNTALLPDAAAADDFGSATLPFKDLWLAGSSGTPGTNNFKLTGASTSGTRVVTFPDKSGTVAMTSDIGGGVAIYAATLADVANTVSETTILSFTIPANSMADGDVIEIRQVNLEKNNKTSAGTAAVKINCGAGAQVTLAAAAAYADSATEYRTARPVWIQRVGATIDVIMGDSGRQYETWNTTPAASKTVGSSTPTNFTSDFVVSIKVTLSAAHATFYIKPQVAKVVHYKS